MLHHQSAHLALFQLPGASYNPYANQRHQNAEHAQLSPEVIFSFYYRHLICDEILQLAPRYFMHFFRKCLNVKLPVFSEQLK